MRRFLAASSFSFFIIAAVLVWLTYKANQQHTLTMSRAVLQLVAAGMAVGLGVAGVRERHRSEARREDRE